jgi:hypothetical protein
MTRPLRRQSALPSLEEALAWLRDVAGELSDVPSRLHDHGTTEGELGAPRFAGAFVAHVDAKPFATVGARREVTCPAYHPPRRRDEPRCVMCDDIGYWMTTTDVYERPLAAALDALGRARSRMRPHPRRVIEALLREGLRPAAAALRLEEGMPGDDPRFLGAIRALYDGFSYTAIMPGSGRMAA